MKRGLTQKQKAVCDLICLGWSNKAIANRLSIGIRTVEQHRQKVYEKMDAHNAVELLRRTLGMPCE